MAAKSGHLNELPGATVLSCTVHLERLGAGTLPQVVAGSMAQGHHRDDQVPGAIGEVAGKTAVGHSPPWDVSGPVSEPG